MDPVLENNELKYRLTLASDLIVFLSSIITLKMDKAKSSELLGNLMNLWTERVDGQMNIIKKEQMEKIAAYAMEGDTEDVLDVIVDAHQTLPNMLRTEFLQKTMEEIQRMVIDIK